MVRGDHHDYSHIVHTVGLLSCRALLRCDHEGHIDVFQPPFYHSNWIGLDWIGLIGSALIRRIHPSARALRSAQKSSWPIMHRSDDQLDLDACEHASVNLPFSHHLQTPMWFEVDQPTT